MSTVDECRIISLPKISNRKGNITPIEEFRTVPFRIARVYYLYDVPGGATRGGHAHKELEQLLIAVMGAFDVVLDDGFKKRSVRLDKAYHGLYVPNLIWRELENFSSGGICLVLASLPYSELDYYRHYDAFLEAANKQA